MQYAKKERIVIYVWSKSTHIIVNWNIISNFVGVIV